MQALLLIAHGSRREQSNEEVVILTEKLKKNRTGKYQIFQAGFLEIAVPSIDSSINKCVKQGATSITVLPYFLNSGLHVIKDIPNAVAKAQRQLPNVKIEVAPHIGSSDLMMNLLIKAASSLNQ